MTAVSGDAHVSPNVTVFCVGLVISFLALNNLMESSLDSARWSSVAWSLPHPIFNALCLEMNAEEMNGTEDPHQWLTLEITYDCMFASGGLHALHVKKVCQVM